MNTISGIIGAIFLALFSLFSPSKTVEVENVEPAVAVVEEALEVEAMKALHPMAIESLRQGDYEADFMIEETLSNGVNYKRFIASYQSEGLKINGLLTVPLNDKPEAGFPTVLFIHGYIPPKQYSTTASYPTYQDRLARNGFVTFKPDLRGHAQSEGEPVSAHYSEKYVIDTLFALSALKKHSETDPDNLFYWGHSNGGEIGLRVVLISDDLRAASFWAGVVGSYEAMFETYNDQISFLADVKDSELVTQNGLPSENPDFWNTIDPHAFLGEIPIPIQLQHGTADDSVPVELSLELNSALEALGKPVEYYEYKGADHNIGQQVSLAFKRTMDFYNQYLYEPVAPAQTSLNLPLEKALERVTKKPFGIKITPATSPVQPERFSGYHSGTDYEVFEDALNKDVPVYAICDGEVLVKRTVNGYGGVLIHSCDLPDIGSVTVLYGHLSLKSIGLAIGDSLLKGDLIGHLGEGYSAETGNERKHLHLSVHKGTTIEYRGYAQSEAQLDGWADPVSVLQ